MATLTTSLLLVVCSVETLQQAMSARLPTSGEHHVPELRLQILRQGGACLH